MVQSDTNDIEYFLKGRSSELPDGDSAVGGVFGPWHVTALLGKGGNGCVYRVVHNETGIAAALKTSSGEGLSSARLIREADFLETHDYGFFPRLYERGEHDGIPYFVMELLEPFELPDTDGAVAELVVSVGLAVQTLHRYGFVHRDIKPSNIMRRPTGMKGRPGELVLIDLGLLKRHEKAEKVQNEISVTVVDGRAVGAGTPRYAAPEQFSGDALSPATDIHALGILINDCFKGNLSPAWERIVARATSTIPERRYVDISAFIKAVRFRHLRRNLTVVFSLFALPAVLFGIFFLLWNGGWDEKWEFYSRGENLTTNVVSKELISVTYATNKFGIRAPVEWYYKSVTSAVDITLFRLEGGTNVFKKPIALDSERELWVLGPGILDAALENQGEKATVRLKDCFFFNRTLTPPPTAGIHYWLLNGVYLNFTEHDENASYRDCIAPYDGAYNDVRFRGPITLEGYRRMRNNEVWSQLQLDN